jgi:hypothetical protein
MIDAMEGLLSGGSLVLGLPQKGTPSRGFGKAWRGFQLGKDSVIHPRPHQSLAISLVPKVANL